MWRAFACAASVAALCCGSRSLVFAQDARACVDGRVQIESGLAERWSAGLAQLCEELPSMKDADPSARLHIAPDGDALILQVALADGRSASRRVRTPDELALTVEALTALPLKPSAAAVPSEAPAAEPPGAHPAASPPAGEPKPSAAPAVASPEFCRWNSRHVLGTGRVARAPTYLSAAGFAGYAGVRIRDWLMELTLRWDLLQVMVGQTPPPDFEMESLGAGFSVGKRVFRLVPALGFDVGGSALLLSRRSKALRTPLRRGRLRCRDVEAGHSRGSVFAAVFGSECVAVGGVSGCRGFAAPFAPGAALSNRTVPTLPSWSLGLGLGAAWSDRWRCRQTVE